MGGRTQEKRPTENTGLTGATESTLCGCEGTKEEARAGSMLEDWQDTAFLVKQNVYRDMKVIKISVC